MGSYEYLPHTADVRIKATGDDLADLFETALKGLCAILYNDTVKSDSDTSKYKLVVSSADSSALIIDFLSDSLLLMYNHKLILTQIKILSINNTYIEAELQGFSVGYFSEDIKAVTYHGAEIITNNESKLEIVITLDI
ncbi:MAG: archease [Ignavibacteriae bacterium]|nr:archease [Ignavibacteriota bacterium]